MVEDIAKYYLSSLKMMGLFLGFFFFNAICFLDFVLFRQITFMIQFSSVQFSCLVVSDSLRPHGLQHTRPPCPSLYPGVCSNSCESGTPSNRLVLCCPLLLLPSIFPSIRVFSNESVLHIRWPKYWSFSSSINPSNEYSGLISFRRQICII